jgi:hypothetical protein
METMRPYAEQLEALHKASRGQDHVNPEVVRRDLEAIFCAWRHAPNATVIAHLCRLVHELEEELDEEEEEFFPAVEHARAHPAGGWAVLKKDW